MILGDEENKQYVGIISKKRRNIKLKSTLSDKNIDHVITPQNLKNLFSKGLLIIQATGRERNLLEKSGFKIFKGKMI